MKLRALTQVLLLLVAMQALSGFKFRCWLFCTDQTGIQTDYVYARDECRKYAQLRLDTDTASPELMEEGNRKSKLISLFSSCMGDKGWTVPDGKSGQQAAAPVPIPTPGASAAKLAAQQGAPAAPTAPQAAIAPMPTANGAIMTETDVRAVQNQQRERNYLARQTECAFARHGAAYSSVSATRAKACDLECEQSRKANEGGTPPAACATSDPYSSGM